MTDSINYTEYCYLMNRIAYWLVNNNKSFNKRDVYGSMGREADLGTIERVIKERGTNYVSDDLIAEYVECAIVDNTDLSFLPSYVTGSDGSTKYYASEFVDMANRVSAFEVLNGNHPDVVYRTSQSTSDTYNYFVQKFGKPSDFDDALRRVYKRGYAYYYNSSYNNKTTIDRMYNKQGVNCTDSSQAFFRIAEALGYEVQFVHIKCSGGDGHIRLRLRKNGGSWFYRDPACTLKGTSGSYTCNWCSNGRVIAYNPSWIFSDLDR